MGDPQAHRIDGRTLSHGTSAVLRRMAVRMVSRGERPSAVMAHFGLCRTTIYRWLRLAQAGGPEALDSRPHAGRAPAVDARGREQVRAWVVDHSPRDHGQLGVLWTRRAIAELVRDRLGIRLSPVAAGRLLIRIGLRPGARAVRKKDAPPPRLLFAVEGRGSFLCMTLSDASPKTLRAAMKRLAAQAGRPVAYLFG